MSMCIINFNFFKVYTVIICSGITYIYISFFIVYITEPVYIFVSVSYSIISIANGIFTPLIKF